MPKYAAQIASALALIKRKGQAITLYRVTVPIYDPLNPSAAVPTVAQQASGFGVILPPSNATLSRYEDVIGSDPQLRQKFRSLILAASGLFAPQAQDIIKTAVGNYRVLGNDNLDPAGDGPILFTIGAVHDVQLIIP